MNEKLYWSGILTVIDDTSKKLNVHKFAITNRRIIDFGPEEDKKGFLSYYFIDEKKVRRENNIGHCNYVTYSTTSSEFIIHIPLEHDYHLVSTENRDTFLTYLFFLKEKGGNESTYFFYSKKKSLNIYKKKSDYNGIPLVPAFDWIKITSHRFGNKLFLKRKNQTIDKGFLSDNDDSFGED